MTITEKMYVQIDKADKTNDSRKKYQGYHLAAIYANNADILNPEELVTELTEKRDQAYAAYCK